MRNDMVIRKCQEEDKERVSDFLKSIFKEMGWEITPEDKLEDPIEYFNSPQGALLIVEDNNQIIGSSGLLSLNSTTCLLKRFYIRADFRGKGVSMKLLKNTLEMAKKMGFKRIVLDVSRNNKRAIKFYQKNSFNLFKTEPYNIWYESKQPENYYYYEKEL